MIDHKGIVVFLEKGEYLHRWKKESFCIDEISVFFCCFFFIDDNAKYTERNTFKVLKYILPSSQHLFCGLPTNKVSK